MPTLGVLTPLCLCTEGGPHFHVTIIMLSGGMCGAIPGKSMHQEQLGGRDS